ncbi:MAG: ABC transporter permease subunit [Methylococcaceae bacterium]|nr:ABC transporter permease subunit [Methylococcaceae bacterium]
MKHPMFLGLHAKPPKLLKRLLMLLPFIILISMYLYASHLRLTDNPHDKLLPSISSMLQAINRVAFEEDRRTGEFLLWTDTLSSLTRLLYGVSFAFFTALIISLYMGLYRGIESLLSAFVIFISMVPPLAILPILFISLGVGEIAKIALIFIGTFPILTRDIFLAVKQIPQQQIVKSLTLGASSAAIIYRIILPQILPRAINSVRLVLGGGWLFLIAAEAIASTDGLGYRIFLVRRYLAMDIIIPYVLWITLLGFCFDFLLRKLNFLLFPWSEEKNQ